MTRELTPDSVLEGLDPEQRYAAQTLSGPVRILAGAGTGKTRTITHRIAYGVLSGAYDQNRVLSLSFTARAAAELRERLHRLGSGEVAARTFHSAALAQLSHFWPQVFGGQLPELLPAKGRLLAQAAELLGLRLDAALLRDVAAEIEWRKVALLSVEEHLRGERPLPPGLDANQLGDLQHAYEHLKEERNRIDFEDVLLILVGLLRAETWAQREVQQRYRFFVVDEYQDVSPLQQTLLDLWLGDRRELCVVGDASQTIYSFTGATSRYLLGFGRRYQDATLIELGRNYRSTPAVLEMANRLIRGRPGALELVPAARDAVADDPSSAAAPRSSTPVFGEFPTERAEAQAIADSIQAAIASGRSPREIAVLYRSNPQSVLLEQALGERGISYQVRGGERFFARPEVNHFANLMGVAAQTEPDSPAGRVARRILDEAFRDWSEEPPAAEPGQSGAAARERWSSLSALLALAEQPGATVRSFTEELARRRQAQHEPELAAVTLTTLHSAKGLEWPSVYLAGLSEGLLPIEHARDEEAVEEERRLLYVGITRAREELRLSWSAQGPQRRRRSPSRFLRELRPPQQPEAAAPDDTGTPGGTPGRHRGGRPRR